MDNTKRNSESPEKNTVLKKRVRKSTQININSLIILFQKRTVSPVKQKPFDALKSCQKLLTDLRTNTKYQFCAGIFYQPVDPG